MRFVGISEQGSNAIHHQICVFKTTFCRYALKGGGTVATFESCRPDQRPKSLDSIQHDHRIETTSYLLFRNSK